MKTGKLRTVPVDLSKLSNVIKNAVKNPVCDDLVGKVNAIQTNDTSKLRKKIPSHDKYITPTAFDKSMKNNFAEISKFCKFVKRTYFDEKLRIIKKNEVKNEREFN